MIKKMTVLFGGAVTICGISYALLGSAYMLLLSAPAGFAWGFYMDRIMGWEDDQ